MRLILSLALVAALSATASAVTIDGSTAGDGYGAALAVQTNETSFGDNLSELNAGYGQVIGGTLYLTITGQVENNFNKLEIWIDANAAGSTTFTSAGNDGAGAMDGLQFDAAFTPETHIIARNGNFGGDRFDFDIANLLTSDVTSQFDLFGGSLTGSGTVAPGPANANPIGIGYDNSNVLGVGGGGNSGVPADPVAAAAVQTGLELAINLADLGYAGGDIRVAALVNNGGHDFASNQVLGGLPIPSGHLANLSTVNFDGLAGDQFFTIPVPEPTSALLASLALVGLAVRRRV